MILLLKIRRVSTIALWLVTVVWITGCATAVERQASSEVRVKKGVPVVYIHPLMAETYSHATVGVLPFLLPEGKDPKFGQQIAALYQDVLLGKAAFPVVKVLPAAYGDFSEALAAGRLAGIDLVLVGKINYAVEGTELGGARLDLTVRMLSVNTGATVWHIGQAMDQPYDYPQTDLVSRLSAALGSPSIKRPAGAPVLVNMLAQAAVDMTDVIVGSRYVRR
ncbi:MAG: hypothetical protein KKD63_11875 [Proteobacteria bacterium]|nr:hypothetical protein [Desulfobulbaceae bacterium]MBU4153571.1 hypothetical protein [Pseudomonadota bacterium]